MSGILVLLLLLILPPACFIWMGLVLGLCFAIIYSGKKIFHIRRDEIMHKERLACFYGVFRMGDRPWGMDRLISRDCVSYV